MFPWSQSYGPRHSSCLVASGFDRVDARISKDFHTHKPLSFHDLVRLETAMVVTRPPGQPCTQVSVPRMLSQINHLLGTILWFLWKIPDQIRAPLEAATVGCFMTPTPERCARRLVPDDLRLTVVTSSASGFACRIHRQCGWQP